LRGPDERAKRKPAGADGLDHRRRWALTSPAAPRGVAAAGSAPLLVSHLRSGRAGRYEPNPRGTTTAGRNDSRVLFILMHRSGVGPQPKPPQRFHAPRAGVLCIRRRLIPKRSALTRSIETPATASNTLISRVSVSLMHDRHFSAPLATRWRP
jgi:hypothetical protein